MIGAVFERPQEQVVREAADAALDKAFHALSEPLASQPCLVGDEFTIADIGDMPYLEHFASTPVQQKLERFPHLLAWWARLRESESCRKIAGRL